MRSLDERMLARINYDEDEDDVDGIDDDYAAYLAKQEFEFESAREEAAL